MSARSKQDLDVLTAVERGETVSQLVLSRRVGVAVGLVNALLKRAVRKGFVKIQNAPARRYVYYLTPKGFTEKSRLVSEYIEWSLSFFRQARTQYADIFERARAARFTTLAIAGHGELVEIAVLAALEQGATVVGIVSTRTNQERMFGLPVASTLDGLGHVDAVIIADSSDAQATYDTFLALLGAERVLAPALLRVSAPGIVAKPGKTKEKPQ